jgi:hypothetical protein
MMASTADNVSTEEGAEMVCVAATGFTSPLLAPLALEVHPFCFLW